MNRMNKKTIRYFFIYLSILILLTSPSLTFHVVEHDPRSFLFTLLVQGALFTLPLILFRKKLRLYFYLLLPIVILAPFAMLPAILFNLEINTDIATLVINTNFGEAMELFGSMVWVMALFFTVYIIAYFVLVRHSARKMSLRTGKITLVTAILVFMISAFFVSGYTNIVTAAKVTAIRYYPTNTAYTLVKYSSAIRKVDHATLVKDFSFGAHKKDSLSERQIYMLVIGETSRYHNWQINGYGRNTTPRLAKRDDYLNFQNVVSGAAMSEQSVPIIITRASPHDYERHYREKSIESIFKESGFTTYWITNQVDYLNIRIHLDEVKNVVSTATSYSTRLPVYDGPLLGEIEKVLDHNADSNLFILVHTMGSHFNYNLRYPPEFDVFQPSGRGKPINPLKKSNKEIMVNAYDNSILYTDYFLDSLMNLLKKQNAVSYFLYLSDHGEDLFDDDRQKSLHTPVEPTLYVARIPMLIWTSARYDSVYHEKFATLKSNVQAPISSDYVFETLVDMSNITYPEADLTKSFASPEFHRSERWILGGNMKLYNLKDLR